VGSSNGQAAPREALAKVEKIAAEVVRPQTASVDAGARFPHEALAALREQKLLAAAIPRELGGLGCSFTEVAAMCTALGQACASTATIFAMHQIQVACMARHGAQVPFFRDYLEQAAEKQLLVASGTSEVGVGGDMRSSIAGVERGGGRFRLQKSCSVLSYGEHADAILITAKKSPEAAAGDQVCALIRKGEYELEKVGVWDTLGMRGTCSPPFKVQASAAEEQILPQSFGDVASLTMVPFSHIVWSSGWLGLATDAVHIARSLMRQEARKRPGTQPFGAPRLVEAVTQLQIMRSTIHDAAREYETLMDDADAAATLTSLSYARRINSVKLASSQLVAHICQLALGVCGVMGYSNASKFSVGRHLRDALGAALMIANDRIANTNAGLLLVSKDDVF
jgi:acyl-CoA dehydrogenase